MPIPTWGEIKIILAVLGVVIIAAASAIVTHKVDAAALLKVENEYQQAEIVAAAAAKAEQAQLDADANAADKAQIAQQQQLLDAAKTRVAAVPKHVSQGANNCITWGLIRTIDAAALNTDADTLSLPAGKTDSQCANVKATTLAASIVGNYGVDQRNAALAVALQTYLTSIAGVKR